MLFRRRFADFLLFGVTSAELAVLAFQTPEFETVDWIYILQHAAVLGIAATRPSPTVQDRSFGTSAAVVVAYSYSYAQMIWLDWMPGTELWPGVGLFLVILASALSFVSLLTLGRSFGIRPALRVLATKGPYRVVRHPMYLSYMIADIGYNLEESNLGTILLTTAGWAALLYRIHAEERVLSHDDKWANYAGLVRHRLVPGLW